MSSSIQVRSIMDKQAPNKSTKIINGKSSNILNWDDVRFAWAYPKYKKMLGNFWTPFEINMAQDRKQMQTLTDEEQEAFLKTIGLLALLDSMQTDYAGKVADYLTDSSLNALMIILAQQEVIHNHSYSYVLSSLVSKSKQDEVFDFWRSEPVLEKRNDFITNGYKEFVENPTVESLLKSIVYDVILEGLFFYSGFAFFYHLARNQKMVGTSTMINYINRDEQIHVDLFVRIFKEVLVEYPNMTMWKWLNLLNKHLKKLQNLRLNGRITLLGTRLLESIFRM